MVFFDALRVKIREDALVRNKAMYLLRAGHTDFALNPAASGLSEFLCARRYNLTPTG